MIQAPGVTHDNRHLRSFYSRGHWSYLGSFGAVIFIVEATGHISAVMLELDLVLIIVLIFH
jgi:hypothetical protein